MKQTRHQRSDQATWQATPHPRHACEPRRFRDHLNKRRLQPEKVNRLFEVHERTVWESFVRMSDISERRSEWTRVGGIWHVKLLKQATHRRVLETDQFRF